MITVLPRYDSLFNSVQSYELLPSAAGNVRLWKNQPLLLLPLLFPRCTCSFSSTEHQPPAMEQQMQQKKEKSSSTDRALEYKMKPAVKLIDL
jgi:hypothetical protein